MHTNPKKIDLGQYRRARKWQRDNPSDIFPTWATLEWFIRQHRQELIASGQLIVRRGSSGTLLGPQFEHVVLDIMRRRSAEQVAPLSSDDA